MKNNTLKYFYQLTKISRQSGNEDAVVDFLVDFVKKNQLEHIVDKYKNVVIFKNKNSENKIILQAHTDMVCVSKNNDFDFENNQIKINTDGDILSAHETSLGADNGLGVSAILSLLCEDLPCGITAIFTSEEETTMKGAIGLDKKYLDCKNLISFDGDCSKSIEIASAGILHSLVNLNFKKYQKFGNAYKITLSGLLGGHSGSDIDKKRTNAIKFCANILKKNSLYLSKMVAGTKPNVIPNFAQMIVLSKDKKNFDITLPEKQSKMDIQYLGQFQCDVFDQKMIDFLVGLPNGVLERYSDNFVKTSVNISAIDTDLNALEFSLRSSNKQSEQFHFLKFEKYIKSFGCKLENCGSNPFFETDKNSKLISNLQDCHKKLFGCDAVLNRVHAGLEGGVFAQKVKDINIAVLGFDIWDMHSTCERVSLKSVDKIYLWAYYFLRDYIQNL